MDSIRLGTTHLSDESFVEAFESCTLPAAQFHHGDHIRLTWIYLATMRVPEATARIAESIRRYAEHHGSARKYHHTMTCAWVRLVDAARRSMPEKTGFAGFLVANPVLLDQKLVARHYSSSAMASPAARASWVDPDLWPLP